MELSSFSFFLLRLGQSLPIVDLINNRLEVIYAELFTKVPIKFSDKSYESEFFYAPPSWRTGDLGRKGFRILCFHKSVLFFWTIWKKLPIQLIELTQNVNRLKATAVQPAKIVRVSPHLGSFHPQRVAYLLNSNKEFKLMRRHLRRPDGLAYLEKELF
jgi:hypothetical protein